MCAAYECETETKTETLKETCAKLSSQVKPVCPEAAPWGHRRSEKARPGIEADETRAKNTARPGIEADATRAKNNTSRKNWGQYGTPSEIKAALLAIKT